MKNILILGASSAIATATARLLAETSQSRFFLLARDETRLQNVADDLSVRGAEAVNFQSLDISEYGKHSEAFEEAVAFLGDIDLLLVAHGTLPDQDMCNQNEDTMLQEFHINATGTLQFLNIAARHFEFNKKGTIAVITSVAGDRGRQSNYLYGSAKAAVSTYLSGLRNRLYKHHVQVLDIRPGFVDTPMTAEFPKGALWAQPEAIAQGILAGIKKGRHVVYLPFFWRYIMLIIRLIPETIFKRLSL